MTPFDEEAKIDLYAWACKRPLWQQDALRRLAEQDQLSEADYMDIQSHVARDNGLSVEHEIEIKPLTQEHCRKSQTSKPTTILGSIGPVKNIDKLAENQRPLKFAINGITVIYGGNASGKSGYCRIAKRLCNSFHKVKLRNNVYAQSAIPCEVNITFKVMDNKQEKQEFLWKDGELAPAELAQISVFDSYSAALYVDHDRKIEFVPFEIDILNKLAGVQQKIELSFKNTEKNISDDVKIALPTGYIKGTSVFMILQKLIPTTRINELPTELEIRTLANWEDKDTERLAQLSIQLKHDPVVQEQTTRRIKTSLEALKKESLHIIESLDEVFIENLKEKRKSAVDKRELAKTSAESLFQNEPISALGGESWKYMLKYAKEFAVEVYVERNDGHLAKGEYCVLCQQELDDSARGRMERFDHYLADRANQDAEIARVAFEEVAKKIIDLKIKEISEIGALLADYSNLNETTKKLTNNIIYFFENSKKRHKIILEAIKKIDYSLLDFLERLPDFPTDIMNNEIEKLQIEVRKYEEMKLASEQNEKLRLEHSELLDRQWLFNNVNIIVNRRNKLEELNRLANCKLACSTTGVTQQITKFRRLLLTDSLNNFLKEEIQELDLKHLPLKIDDRGRYGESIVKIGLAASRPIDKNSNVLSESEQRALGLACFLAELKEERGNHGIIVDDPVSSLDHLRMEVVAKRLVKAANERQVIIFTHNLPFFHMVMSEACCKNIPVHNEWISKSGDNLFGMIDDNQRPWVSMKVKDRIAKINDKIKEIESSYDHNKEQCRESVRIIYTMMRETWEKVVEEILFSGVIDRFRPEVKTLQLRSAHMCEDDYKSVHEGMGTCSRYSGHDSAEQVPPDLPKLSEIQDTMKKLVAYEKLARDRKNKLEEIRSSTEKKPRVAEVM